MAEYIVQSENLTAIADKIRVLSGTESAMGLDDMATHVGEANMDIATEADLIEQINAALEGKAAGGEQTTPIISVNSTNGLITATAGTKTSTHQLAFQPAKTITPSTASQIAVSGGYYTGGNITVAAIPSQYVVPSGTLTISANGTHDVKNYASAVVNIESGTGSGEAAEWSENEDAIISGTISSYTNDRVVTIGSYAFASYPRLTTVSFPAATIISEGAFGYCSKLTTANFPACTTISRYAFRNCPRLTTVSFPAVTIISTSAFYNCSSLTTVSFPACTSIDGGAFENCSRLTSVSFPACTTISRYAFRECVVLTTANFPACTSIGSYAFRHCASLTTANFPACTYIDDSAFLQCYNLKSLYLTGSSLCTLSNSNAFTSTPIGGYSKSTGTYGSIYVPASLLTSYQTATNWTYFSSRFVGI